MSEMTKQGVDMVSVNTEMNKIYYLSNVLNTSKDRLELLLKNKFTHKFKYELNMCAKWLRKVVNNAEKLYKENVEAYEDNTEMLDELIHIAMHLDTEEKKIQAISSLKQIAQIK